MAEIDVVLDFDEEEEMPKAGEDSLTDTIRETLVARILNAGAMVGENAGKVIHYTDTDYLEGRRVIGLTEAVGVREVQSKETPGGPANANRA